MPATETADAVARFAESALRLNDTDLTRDWAWNAYKNEGVRFAFFRTYEELRELAARIAVERRPQSAAQRILAQHHAAYVDLRAVLLGLPDDLYDQPPAPEEWPVRRTLAHTFSSERIFYALVHFALQRFRAGEPPVTFDQPEAEQILGPLEDFRRFASSAAPAELLAAFEEQHARALTEFSGISTEEIEAPSHFWEGYPMPLRFRLHRFDSHLRQHTIQVEKTLADVAPPPAEIQRLLRLIYNARAEVEGMLLGDEDTCQEERKQTAQAITARAAEIAA